MYLLGVARYTDVTVRYVPRFGGSRFDTISVQHEKKSNLLCSSPSIAQFGQL